MGYSKGSVARVETSKKRLDKELFQTKEALEKKLYQRTRQLDARIRHTQVIATGAPLLVLDNPKKFLLMEARLRAFAACVKGDGGESCLKGK